MFRLHPKLHWDSELWRWAEWKYLQLLEDQETLNVLTIEAPVYAHYVPRTNVALTMLALHHDPSASRPLGLSRSFGVLPLFPSPLSKVLTVLCNTMLKARVNRKPYCSTLFHGTSFNILQCVRLS